MPRPVLQQLPSAPSYVAPATQAVQPAVVTQVDPGSAGDTAMALSKALGVVGDTLDYLKQKDTKAGTTDAEANQVDPERAKASQAYARAANNVLADRQTMDFIDQYSAHYANDIDKNAPVDQVEQDFDTQARGQLSQWLADPHAAAVVGPRLEAYRQQLHSQHVSAQSVERASLAVTTVQDGIKADIGAVGSTDFSAQFAKLAPMIGNTAAKKAVVDAVLDSAVAAGRPDAIKASLPDEIVLGDGTRIPGPAKDANLAVNIVASTEKAKTVLLHQNEQSMRDQKGALEQSWIKNPLLFTDSIYNREIAKPEGPNRLFTSDELNGYLKARDAELAAIQQSSDFSTSLLANPQLRIRSLLGTPKDTAGNNFSEDDLEKLFDRRVNDENSALPAVPGEDPSARVTRIAVQQSSVQGYAFRPLAESLQKAPPSDAAAYQSSAQVYNQIPAFLRPLYVPSEQKRAEYESYLSRLSMGDSPKEATQALVTRDPTVVNAALAEANKNWTSTQKSLGNTVVDFAGANVHVKDFTNSAQVYARVQAGAKIRVENGISPSDAAQFAAKDVLDSSYVIRGGRNGPLLLPLEPGVARADAEPATKWLMQSVVPTIKDSTGAVIGKRKVYLSTIPSSSDNTTLVLMDDTTGRRVAGSPVFSLADIVKQHKAFLAKAGYDAAKQRNSTEPLTIYPEGSLGNF